MDAELVKLGLRGITMVVASGDTGAYSGDVEDKMPKVREAVGSATAFHSSLCPQFPAGMHGPAGVLVSFGPT
jgi:hypothetical protein